MSKPLDGIVLSRSRVADVETDAAVRVMRSPAADEAAANRRAAELPRVRVMGKFLYADGEKLYLKGTTYGPFRPNDLGCTYHDPAAVDRDFRLMTQHGINCVRLYTVPPAWLLDLAAEHGLRLLIGVAWDQAVAFLDEPHRADEVEATLRAGVRACDHHPAVLAYVLGNEIPPSIVRWHGRKAVERFLDRLCAAVKEEDPQALVTYANYPTTAYLELPFLDFLCFNVYLEDRKKLWNYVAMLQNQAGDRPLVMSEIGQDSMGGGLANQTRQLDAQLRTVFAAGCAGAFVFAWTDEWFRHGYDVTDWAFGLVDRNRIPKPALATVAKVFADVPVNRKANLPRISVVVCSYNGSRTLGETLSHLVQLDYPEYEVIVVNDGSKDKTSQIAHSFPVRVLDIPNGGLSNARNMGAKAATGEIVAYIDDDAYPDPHWLLYLAVAFKTSAHVGVGGPNIPPYHDGLAAACVSHSPGGPNHVLISDQVAEHIPGCNMAFRRKALLAIGGFDTRYRIAGDDVDVCWRLQDRGWTLGFHGGAMVWHHRRNSIKTYLKQQTNYGRAEAMLEQMWPHKFNGFGHITWGGRIYGVGNTLPPMLRRGRVFHGVWGLSPFQAIYPCPTTTIQALPLMPEWYLVVAALTVLSLFTFVSSWFALALPVLTGAVVLPVVQALVSARQAPLCRLVSTRNQRLKYRAVITLLHLLQPMVRLRGRLMGGLSLIRRHRVTRLDLPRPRTTWRWSYTGGSPESHLTGLERAVARLGVRPRRGGVFDRYDLELHGTGFAHLRVLMAVEYHSGSLQLLRLRSWPIVSKTIVAWAVGFIALALTIGAWTHPLVPTLILLIPLALVTRAVFDVANITGAYLEAIRPLAEDGSAPAKPSAAPVVPVINLDDVPTVPGRTEEPVSDDTVLGWIGAAAAPPSHTID